jgi:hypothetical protein
MKTKKIHLLLLSLIMVILLAKMPLISIAQSKPNQPPKNQSNQPKKERSTWEAILAIFDTKKPLGSKSVNCFISPGILEKVYITWNKQPVFIWQGGSTKSEIRLYSPYDQEEAIWITTIEQKSSDQNFQYISYTGQPLELDKIYDWEIYDSKDGTTDRRTFKLMGIDDYNRIKEELKNLEAQLKLQQLTEEQIVLEKVAYFTEKGLFSDALTTMYSIENPSPQFIDNRQNLLNSLCVASKKS